MSPGKLKIEHVSTGRQVMRAVCAECKVPVLQRVTEHRGELITEGYCPACKACQFPAKADPQ